MFIIIGFLASLLFMAAGIAMLKIAYDMPSPLEFLVVFFSSNLLILIGASIAVGLVIRAISKKREKGEER